MTTDDGKLTSEQRANWKRTLSASFGLPSWFLTDKDVQEFRDKTQREADQKALERAAKEALTRQEASCTAYKVVVSTLRGDLESFSQYSAWAYSYTPEKWMSAFPGSGLFVFATQDQAMNFASASIFRSQVWGCECEGPMATPPMVLGMLYSDVPLQRFWSNHHLGLPQPLEPHLIKPPEGTLLFKRVKLIMRLTPQAKQGPF